MPSPFPGMNPYLEQRHQWQGFHNQLVGELGSAVLGSLPERYYLTTEAQLYLQELPDERWRPAGKPDVTVAAGPGVVAGSRAAAALGGEPVYLIPTLDEQSLLYLEIRDRRHHHVVTVVELLSPANKDPGPDREQYLAKRAKLLRGGVSVVEIDLLRGGPRLIDVRPCDYCTAVFTPADAPAGRAWPCRLEDRLPVIPIPLAAEDPPLRVDLQTVLHTAYDRGGYRRYIYDGDPVPPLTPEQAAWASQFVPKPPPLPAP